VERRPLPVAKILPGVTLSMFQRLNKGPACGLSILLWLAGCSEPSVEIGINSIVLGGKCYLMVANCDSLKEMFKAEFSIEVWAAGDTSKPDSARTLIMFGNDAGGDELAIYRGAKDSSLVQVYIDDVLFGNYHIGGLDWRKPVFHHVCLTQVDGYVSFYFDGELIDYRLINGLTLDIGSSNMLIGADYDPPGVNAHVGKYWQGKIDEIRFWRRWIDADEVRFHADHPDKLLQHYSAENYAALFGIWRFNAEVSDFVPDESGNGLNAALKGDLKKISWSEAGAE